MARRVLAFCQNSLTTCIIFTTCHFCAIGDI